MLDSLAVECLKHVGVMVEGDTLSAEADRITTEMIKVAPPTFDPQLEGNTFSFKINCSNCMIAGAVITREQGVISHAKIEEGDGFHTMYFSDTELDGKVIGYQVVTEKVMISGAYKLVDGVLSHDRTMYIGRKNDGSFIFISPSSTTVT